MNFQWDPEKALRNRVKQDVIFEETVTAFGCAELERSAAEGFERWRR